MNLADRIAEDLSRLRRAPRSVRAVFWTLAISCAAMAVGLMLMVAMLAVGDFDDPAVFGLTMVAFLAFAAGGLIFVITLVAALFASIWGWRGALAYAIGVLLIAAVGIGWLTLQG